MPPGTACRAATITVTGSDGAISTGMAQIAAVAPGLFSANASGQGVAAALALRIKAVGSGSSEPVAQFDLAQNRFVTRALSLRPRN
ncbi:MAG: hypothetical protein L0387_07635 [Acidobacteria bacterium]|nr:hypothetical protein [Acidobacteriota bacterium]MCI0717413.1 hypothetical protein [Acidobacteriota bacterium]